MSKPKPLNIHYGEKPPNYEAIVDRFNPKENFVFTYGTDCYSPSLVPMPEHLKVHEAIHAQQQTDPEKWWAQFLSNSEFRLEQELEAYRAQYQFFCSREYNDRKRYVFLNSLALDLSGPSYGYIISNMKAAQLIKQAYSIK